ncbi:MAG TPA: hypothetical protein VGT78_00850 [Rhizomicrobium sp.]|nr:hypothetical protein [Rhizomicrobium sp.]
MNYARRMAGGKWILPFAIGTWVLIIVQVEVALPLAALMRLAVFTALALLFYAKLQRSGFSIGASCIIAALTLAQPALFLSIHGPSHGIWLAIGIYAIAASVETFMRREDARSIMQLGGSLALLQILDPLGGLIVAALVPGLFGLNRKELKMAHSAGLYGLVLFMPVITALALAYLSRIQHIDLPQLMLGYLRADGISPATSFSRQVIMDFMPLPIVAPVLLRNFLSDRNWTRSTISVLLIACAVSLAAVIATFLGASCSPLGLAAAAAPLPLFAIADWSSSPSRVRDAIAVVGTTAILAWACTL